MINTEIATDMEELAKFISDPKYAAILKKAVEAEERLDKDQYRAGHGWEWHEVQAHPGNLMKLVVAGILRVAYKSNRSTMYLLVDRQAVKRAVKDK
jgi:hypothetical protein